MALTIVVRSGDTDPPPTITFDAPRVVIGRGEGCDVRLPDPSVSHRHASIRQRGTEYIVVDEGSTNGTFVGPVLLSPQASRVVKSGDRIRVGRVWLEVVVEQVPATREPQLATKEIALGLVASALKAQGQVAELVVSIVQGPDQGLSLEISDFQKRYVLGRGKGADLQVTDADASRRHVELERRGDQIRVRELGSKNGSILDGNPLSSKPTVWKPGQLLKFGGNHASYADPISAALSELEGAQDETLDPTEEFEAADPDLSAAELGGAVPTSTAGTSGGGPLVQYPTFTRRPTGKSRLMSADVFVGLLALVVLLLSGLGLFWLFNGP